MQPTNLTSASSSFVNVNQTISSANTAFSQPSFPSVMQISNVEDYPSNLPSVYHDVTQVNPAQSCFESQALRFQVSREPVPDKFWKLFKQPVDQKRFEQLYTYFLFTDWNPSKVYKLNLKSAQIENGNIASYRVKVLQREDNRKNIVKLYDALVEVHLYNSLKNRALYLIHSIMETYKYGFDLSDPQIKNKDRINIKKLRIKRINKIASHFDSVYENNYKKNAEYINKSNENKTVEDIDKLKKEIRVLRNETAKYKKKISNLGSSDLPLINHILDLLIKNQNIEYQADKIFSVPDTSLQESDQPPKKKRCANLNTSSTQYRNTIKEIDFFHNLKQSFDFFQHKETSSSAASRFLPVDHQDEMQNDPQYQSILQDLVASVPSEHFMQGEENFVPLSSPTTQLESNISQEYDINYDFQLADLKLPAKSTKSLQISNILKDKVPQVVHNISEEALFIFLINIMIGKETLIYDEEKGFCEELNIQPENLYNSRVMLSAINAKILLLKLKNKVADLINHENNKNRKGIASTRRTISRNLFTLADNIKVHQTNMAILQSEKKNEQPIDTSRKQLFFYYGFVRQEIQNSIILLKEEQAVYDETMLSNCNVQREVLQRLQKLMRERMSLSAAAKSFPSLSSLKMMQLVDDYFILSSIQHSTPTPLLKFALGRNAVNASFWELLKNNISISDFNKQYSDFIYTSWEPPLGVASQLEYDICSYIEHDNISRLHEILIEQCFQESLKLQAFYLIHYILNVIKNVDLLNNASDEARKKIILRTVNTNINKINDNQKQAYRQYVDYLERRNQQTMIDIHTEIRKIDTLIRDNRRYIFNNKKADSKDMSTYLLIINDVLKEWENQGVLDSDATIKMINEYLLNSASGNEQSCALPFSASEDFVAPSTLQFSPMCQDELVMHQNAINFIQSPSFSHQIIDEAENDHANHTNEELQSIAQLKQMPGLEAQIEEFLEMDENSFLNFFSSSNVPSRK